MRSGLVVTLILSALTGWWLLSASRTPAASLPANAPVVGKAILAGGEPDGTREVLVPVCNRSHSMLRASVVLESGGAEIVRGDGRQPVPGQRITSFTDAPGTYCHFEIFRIKSHRTQPVRFRVAWQDGSEANSYVQSIAAEDDGVTRLK